MEIWRTYYKYDLNGRRVWYRYYPYTGLTVTLTGIQPVVSGRHQYNYYHTGGIVHSHEYGNASTNPTHKEVLQELQHLESEELRKIFNVGNSNIRDTGSLKSTSSYNDKKYDKKKYQDESNPVVSTRDKRGERHSQKYEVENTNNTEYHSQYSATAAAQVRKESEKNTGLAKESEKNTANTKTDAEKTKETANRPKEYKINQYKCTDCRQEYDIRFKCGHEICAVCFTKIHDLDKCGWLCHVCHKYSLREEIKGQSGLPYFVQQERGFLHSKSDHISTPVLATGESSARFRYPSTDVQGIPNIGMTCYANSVLQVLAQTPNLLERLRNTASRQQNFRKTNTVTEMLVKLLEGINRRDGRVIKRDDIDMLMSQMFKLDTSFCLYEQNDCHSFLISLFNVIKEESLLIKSDENRNPVDMFEGEMANKFTFTTCDCKEYSEEQMFNSLLIPILTKIDKWSLEKGIQSLLGSEEFKDNMVPCRNCESRGKIIPETITTKKLEIIKPPDVLILQLGRYREEPYMYEEKKFLRKSYTRVGYPTTLDLQYIHTHDRKPRSKVVNSEMTTQRYSLYAVVLHLGSLRFGHYYSYVKLNEKGKNKWFRCSDSSVHQIEEREIEQEEGAFLLFYHREK